MLATLYNTTQSTYTPRFLLQVSVGECTWEIFRPSLIIISRVAAPQRMITQSTAEDDYTEQVQVAFDPLLN